MNYTYAHTGASMTSCGSRNVYGGGVAIAALSLLLRDAIDTGRIAKRDMLNRRFNDACDTLAAQIQEMRDLKRDLTYREKTALILALRALLDLNEILIREKCR